MNIQQINAVREVARAIVATVQEAGEFGAPAGILYAALMSQGCSLHQFEQIMAGLVRAGIVTKDGDCYHATGKAMPQPLTQ